VVVVVVVVVAILTLKSIFGLGPYNDALQNSSNVLCRELLFVFIDHFLHQKARLNSLNRFYIMASIENI
jgi:hypothetical protein